MSDEATRRSIEDLIEASSLGTAEAKAARESVPVEVGQAIALLATHQERFDFRGDSLGCSCGHHWLYKGHLAQVIAERIAQARLDGLCASCGEPAKTTSKPNGRLTLVCLRHYNVWQTPAALRSDDA